jgi:alpha-beta hydrolase superfamily lysophospholipase
MATVKNTSLNMTDGTRLSVWDYPDVALSEASAVVVLVHGLGEHQGRYGHVAAHLAQWGYAVRSYDHVGHGLSAGTRGGISRPMQMVDHLVDVLKATRARMAPQARLLVLGHSLGGLVAARTAMAHPEAFDGLVLSSPALDAGMTAVQRVLVSTLPYLLPNLRVSNGLNLDDLSHDARVAEAYREDPLCHDKISARLAKFIGTEGAAVIGHASSWPVRTLLLYSGQDRCVSPLGSQRFAQRAPQAMVSSSVFHSLKHEIFNEQDVELVWNALRSWLDSGGAIGAGALAGQPQQ